MKPKSSKNLAIIERRKKVSELHLQGWGQIEIANELKVRQSTISVDLKQISKAWRESSIRDFDELRDLELARIDKVFREAWAGYIRSQQPHQSATTDGEAGAQKAKRTIRNQYGDPRFLSVILDCIQSKRELLGLDAPVKVAQTTPEGAPLTNEQRNAHIQAILSEYLQLEGIQPSTLIIDGAKDESGTNQEGL